MKKTKTQKGITLIALIITIVVLLILAVVAIGAVQDSNIIAHTQNAATQYENAKKKENELLAGYLSEIEANLPGGTKVYDNGIFTDGPVTNTYGEDWTYAYVFNGTSWDGPKEKANGDTAEGQIVAKFYKQTYSVDPDRFTYKTYTMDPLSGDAYKLAIEGTGAMGNFIDMTAMPPIGYAWKDNDVKALFGIPYDGLLLSPYVTEITICDGIIDIGSYTFLGSTSLQNVVLSNTVETIGNCAFTGCSKLETISMSRETKTIGEAAFDSCVSIKSIALPVSLTNIGKYAFYGCESIKSIILPENLTTIEDYTFQNCSSLSVIVLPENLKTIGFDAFTKCISLTEVIIPKGVTELGTNAFKECTTLKEVIILSDNIWIRTEVFSECTNLRKLKIYATTLNCDASIGIAEMPEDGKIYVLDEDFVSEVSGVTSGDTIKGTIQVVTKEQMNAL